jgi:hypothetical protein
MAVIDSDNMNKYNTNPFLKKKNPAIYLALTNAYLFSL